MTFEVEHKTSDDRPKRPSKNRNRHTGRTVLLVFVAFFLVAAAAAGLFAFNLVQSFDSKAQQIDNAFPDASTRPEKVGGATNMLLLGSASRGAAAQEAAGSANLLTPCHRSSVWTRP